MCLTSCEGALDDVLGEWSRPTPGNNTNTTPTADHSNQYLVYSYSTALDSVWTDIPSGATVWTGTVAADNVAAGTYVVEGTATCANQLVLMGEVNLILKDGAKLTVDEGIIYDTSNGVGSLNIYGQGISSSMGQLIVNHNTPDTGGEATAVAVTSLTIHGGKIDATADTGGIPAATAGGDGLEVPTAGDIIIYNGFVTATATNARQGIALWNTGKIDIHSGEIFAYSPGGQGIIAQNAGNDATLNITGGKVTAKDNGTGGEGINCDIVNISGGTVLATNGAGGNPALKTTVSITISGSETQVTATGGNDDGTSVASYGIYTKTLNIDGGLVTATGGNGGAANNNGQCAVWCSDGADGALNVTGGKLIANGGDAAGGTAGTAIDGTGLVYTLTGVSFYQGAALPVDTSTPGTTPCTMQYVVIQ